VGDQACGHRGYEKAEVTAGGVDTDELSIKTMECLNVKGLFFIGDVVDVNRSSGWIQFSVGVGLGCCRRTRNMKATKNL